MLHDLVATVPFSLQLEVAFTHAREVRTVQVELGWFKIRLLDTHQVLWVLVVHEKGEEEDPFRGRFLGRR